MTDGDATDALEQALALLSAPGRASLLRRRPLPGNVLTLIRIVAGDGDSIADAASRTGETSRTVVDAARLYVQRVLFDDAADSYRMLGVRPEAPDETIKLHYRYLMRWLHPDRQPERWEVAYAERVNHAWHSLNSTERRTRYDDEARALTDSQGASSASHKRQRIERIVNRPAPHPMLSSRAVRWLPGLVLGGLAMSSALVLGLLYWAQHMHDRTASVAVAAAPPEQPENATQAGSVVSGKAASGAGPVADQTTGGQIASKIADDTSQPQGSASSHGADSATLANAGAGSIESPHAAGVAAPDAMDAEIASVRQAVENQPGNGTPVVDASARPPVSSQPTLPPAVRPALHILAGTSSVKLPTGTPALASAGLKVDSGDPGKANPGAVAKIKPTATMASTAIVQSPKQAPAARLPVAVYTPAVAAVGVESTAAERPALVVMQAAIQKPEADSDVQSPEDGAATVTRAFVTAYDKGDLQQFLRLFTPDAVNDRGGIAAITDDYSSFFRDSKVRTLHLEHVSWVYKSDRIVGTGSFDAHFVDARNPVTHDVHGWMRIEAVPIDGLWKIQRLQHGNSE